MTMFPIVATFAPGNPEYDAHQTAKNLAMKAVLEKIGPPKPLPDHPLFKHEARLLMIDNEIVAL